MAQVFVWHDEQGRILSVARVERMAEGLNHPFVVSTEGHGVIAISEEELAAGSELHEIHQSHSVDITTSKLVPTNKPPSTEGKRSSRAGKK